jgi:hypothetical protein
MFVRTYCEPFHSSGAYFIFAKIMFFYIQEKAMFFLGGDQFAPEPSNTENPQKP